MRSKTRSPMQSPLFKPTAPPARTADAPLYPARIVGAHAVHEQRGTQVARFSGSDLEAVGYIFLEDRRRFATDVEVVFESGCQRMLFLRAERYQTAKLLLGITVEREAEAHVVVLLKNAAEAALAADIKAKVAEQGRLTISMFHLNQGQTTADISVINATGAHSEMALFDVGRGNGKADFRLENICAAPFSGGQLTTRCMLYDQAKSRIQGVPVIAPDAHDTSNHLDQMSILFSPHARAESVPLLSVSNNAVSASHRSAIARLSDEDVFYFNTRGISRREAEKLYLSGFLGEVSRQIPVGSIAGCTAEAVHHFLEDVA